MVLLSTFGAAISLTAVPTQNQMEVKLRVDRDIPVSDFGSPLKGRVAVLRGCSAHIMLVFFLTLTARSFAQSSATLSGTVTDSSGSGVANVLVTATNKDTRRARKARTSADGMFRFSPLPPGDYRVKFTAGGFKTADIESVSVNVTETAVVNQVLAPERATDAGWKPAPQAADPPAHDPCTSGHEFATTDCTLTWHGITLYGAYDVGAGWVSHGLPENGYNYEGASLINRNGYEHRFLVAPNNLQQTGLGVRGKEEIAHGWSVVFNASSGINPQSGLLANASATDFINNGLPRSSYSYAIDGARAGQPFNDEIYAGVSSTDFGTLTFGRQRSLGTDAMLLYDPAGGSYAFSYIGYNGTMAGGGDTENSRWDDALKYRLTYGPVHFGAMYKFADGSGGCYSASAGWTASTCSPESAHNNAYGFDFGGGYRKFFADVVFQHYNQAISVLNPLLGPQSPSAPYQSTTDSINTNPITGANLIDTTNTLYGIVTDNSAIMAAARYTWDPFKFFGGYEYIWQNNPTDPLGVGASDQGGYFLSGVEDNNLDSEKLVEIWWMGSKYAVDSKTDLTLAWYHQQQNDFRRPSTCSPDAGFRSSCAGDLDEVSLYADHHFTKRFDGFTGIAYSWVSGGLAIAIPHGPGVPYRYDSNLAPVIGGRFVF
jgi:predicted porin